MNFADRLTAAIEEKGTPSIVGIDPRYAMLPAELKHGDNPTRAEAASAVEAFGIRLVDVVAPLVPAVKPNIAFFEQFGWEGYRAYMNIVARAREKGLLVVADAKRGDIGSTAEAYAVSLFDEMDVDAVTLSPWLGEDSLKPFFARFDRGKGCFLLVKTSNPSSADIQDREQDGGTVFTTVAGLVRKWGNDFIGERGLSSVGAVVGATFPEQAADLRERMPTTPFLLPGYGAQGGKAESLRNAFGPGGTGALVNSSRGIIFAYAREPYAAGFGEDRWEDAVRAATLAMRADLAGAVPDATWAGA